MVSDPFLVGFFFGFVPAMGFLYIVLHRYEGLFSERRAFFAFLLGVAGGLVATLLQLVLAPASSPFPMLALYAVLFGLSDALILAMILNSKRFRGKRDTGFYGVGVGLGFGAMNVLFLVGKAVIELEATPGNSLLEAVSLSLLGVFLIATMLVHAAVGAWIGRGATFRTLPAEVARGAAWETVFLVGFYFLFDARISPAVPWVAIFVGVALVHYVMRNVLDPLIPPEILREMTIHKRRIARDVMLSATRPTGSGPDEARTPGSPPEDAPPPDPARP